MTAAIPESARQQQGAGEAQLDLLRTLLMGKDYGELLELKAQIRDSHRHSVQLAAVISEALALRSQQDSSLTDVLMPTVEQALGRSIERDPKHLAGALYPVMGPAIRKSINESLTQTLETFNQLLEQSISLRSLRWRFDAWRTGRSYSEVVLSRTLLYQVEQVFLIHRESGLLLQHVVSEQAITKDPDMVSGMLTAIQDFIRDSFDVGNDDALNNMRLGELAVLVEQGPYAVVAAVVHGNPPASVRDLLKSAQEDIHRQMRQTLTDYQGDNGPFARIRPLLERCLTSQQQIAGKAQAKGKPWLAWLVLAGLVAGLGYWALQRYLEQLGWQHSLALLQAEPGLVVTGTEKTPEGYRVTGLRDPLARDPALVVPDLQSGVPRITLDFRSYLAMEPAFVMQRVRQALQAPAGVELALQGSTLLVSGQADMDWKRKLNLAWPLIPGISQLDGSRLQVDDPDVRRKQAELARQQAEEQQQQAEKARLQQSLQQRIAGLQQMIDTAGFQFEYGIAETNDAGAHAKQLAATIRDLLAAARQNGQMIQVELFGSADGKGTREANARIARDRADNIYRDLIAQGVPAALLVVNEVETGVRTERSVRYRVSVY
ncbi:MAG: hypothetical protein R3E89_09240 [Thiolinea sp.]